MAQTIGGVVCQELVQGYTEGAGAQGLQSTKRYLCDWSNRYLVANSFLGLTLASGGIGSFLNITSPLPHPESPNIIAREVFLEGAGTPTQGTKQLQFPYAIITVNYGVNTWNAFPSDDPYGNFSFDPQQPYIYASQELEWSAEFVNITNQNLQFSDSTPLPGKYGTRIPNATLVLTLHRLPWLPMGNVINYVGKLNVSTWLQCAAGTLRFDGAGTQRTAATDGSRLQEVTYKFTYRSAAPWDYAYNGKAKAWQQVQVVGTGTPPILSRIDLSPLIPSQYVY